MEAVRLDRFLATINSAPVVRHYFIFRTIWIDRYGHHILKRICAVYWVHRTDGTNFLGKDSSMGLILALSILLLYAQKTNTRPQGFAA
jgi:hypothetical protein